MPATPRHAVQIAGWVPAPLPAPAIGWRFNADPRQLAIDLASAANSWLVTSAVFLERPDTQALLDAVATVTPEPYAFDLEFISNLVIATFAPDAAGRQEALRRLTRDAGQYFAHEYFGISRF
jgi:hypothetical protein